MFLSSRARPSVAGARLLLLFFATCLPLLLTFSHLTHSTTAAGIRYASPSGFSTGSCASWVTACTPEYAYSIASPGEEIWVEAGEYRLSSSIFLTDAISIYGGFIGSESVRDARNSAVNRTVFSGDIGNDDVTNGIGIVEDPDQINGNNLNSLIVATYVTSGTVIDGLVLTAADSRAIVLESSSPTLSHLHIQGNRGSSGAGLFVTNGNPTLNDILFTHNSADSFGGGMYTDNSAGILTRVDFIENDSGSSGGGLYANDGGLIVQNSTFLRNRSDRGGAIANNNSGTPRYSAIIVQDNDARVGAGIYNQVQTAVEIDEAFILENVATEAGGGIYNLLATVTLISGTLTDNEAPKGQALTTGCIANLPCRAADLSKTTAAGQEADCQTSTPRSPCRRPRSSRIPGPEGAESFWKTGPCTSDSTRPLSIITRPRMGAGYSVMPVA